MPWLQVTVTGPSQATVNVQGTIQPMKGLSLLKIVILTLIGKHYFYLLAYASLMTNLYTLSVLPMEASTFATG